MKICMILALLLASAISESRTWHSGQYQTSATLVDFQGGVAYLKKDSGKIAAVPVSKLSAADNEFIKSTAPAVKVIEGKVIGVTDGDTLTVLDGTTTHRIRLEGIDAPESHQAFGAKSHKALAAKAFEKPVRVEWREFDKYKRVLGHVFVDDRWVNKDMVQEGWAWHYLKYSASEVLSDAEVAARIAKVGLWADDAPTPPWDFRQPVVATPKPKPKADPPPKIEPPEPESHEITVYVTRTGEKYHREGCQHLRQSKIPMSLSEASKQYTPCKVCGPPSSAPEPVTSFSSSGGEVQVRGYYRKDGTYVRPHTRRRPSR